MRLTDKQKLDIIEGFKEQLEKSNEARKRDPNWEMPTEKTKMVFRKEQFEEMDKIWLETILEHLGVDSEFI